MSPGGGGGLSNGQQTVLSQCKDDVHTVCPLLVTIKWYVILTFDTSTDHQFHPYQCINQKMTMTPFYRGLCARIFMGWQQFTSQPAETPGSSCS